MGPTKHSCIEIFLITYVIIIHWPDLLNNNLVRNIMLLYSSFTTFLWLVHLGNNLKMHCTAQLSNLLCGWVFPYFPHQAFQIGTYCVKSCGCCAYRSGTHRPSSSFWALLILMGFVCHFVFVFQDWLKGNHNY